MVMNQQKFDIRFQEIFTKMVEIAFEFVGRNDQEVEKIFIYGSMEAELLYFDCFYKINGKIVETHEVNDVLTNKCDNSDQVVFQLHDLGIEFLQNTIDLFKEFKREVPTLLKMTFQPATSKFETEISYDLHYTNHLERLASDGLDEWISSEK